MKTIHWHKYLKPEELQNIYDTIEYCNQNTQRRKSVLGWAQQNTPNAYQEYIDKANKNFSVHSWFKTFNTDPKHLKYRFWQREQELNEILLEKQRS